MEIPQTGTMDYQRIWLAGLCKGGDTWTGELLTSLTANFNKAKVPKMEDRWITLSSIDDPNNDETSQCTQGAKPIYC